MNQIVGAFTEYKQLFDENGQANPLFACNESSDRHSRRSRGSQHASRFRRTSNDASSTLRPTEKQYRFVETISNRLGIENPWTKRGCIFGYSYDGDLPRFMNCGPTRYEASKWIGRHQSKFNEALAAKKASNPAFSVYRIEYTDGTFFLHIGTQVNHGPSIDVLKGKQIAGISVWVGESVPKQKLAEHTAAQTDDLDALDEMLDDSLASMIEECEPILDEGTLLPDGEWMSQDEAKRVEPGLRKRSYVQAKRTLAYVLAVFCADKSCLNDVPADARIQAARI